VQLLESRKCVVNLFYVTLCRMSHAQLVLCDALSSEVVLFVASVSHIVELCCLLLLFVRVCKRGLHDIHSRFTHYIEKDREQKKDRKKRTTVAAPWSP